MPYAIPAQCDTDELSNEIKVCQVAQLHCGLHGWMETPFVVRALHKEVHVFITKLLHHQRHDLADDAITHTNGDDRSKRCAVRAQ